jgi:hypothetical protein
MTHAAVFRLWFAVCATAGVALLVAMYSVLDGSALMFCVGCQESLDKAQLKFETEQRDDLYRFDAWRSDGVLKCQNAPTLRICRASPVVGYSEFGAHRSFMSFACSATECAWVDP